MALQNIYPLQAGFPVIIIAFCFALQIYFTLASYSGG